MTWYSAWKRENIDLTLRDVHDGDGDAGDDVRQQVLLDLVVEQPVRDGEVLVEEALVRSRLLGSQAIPNGFKKESYTINFFALSRTRLTSAFFYNLIHDISDFLMLTAKLLVTNCNQKSTGIFWHGENMCLREKSGFLNHTFFGIS